MCTESRDMRVNTEAIVSICSEQCDTDNACCVLVVLCMSIAAYTYFGLSDDTEAKSGVCVAMDWGDSEDPSGKLGHTDLSYVQLDVCPSAVCTVFSKSQLHIVCSFKVVVSLYNRIDLRASAKTTRTNSSNTNRYCLWAGRTCGSNTQHVWRPTQFNKHTKWDRRERENRGRTECLQLHKAPRAFSSAQEACTGCDSPDTSHSMHRWDSGT